MTENKILVQLDLNEMMKAYNKEEFMKNVFVEYLKKNPDSLSNHLFPLVLSDIIKSEGFKKIQESVESKVMSALDKHLDDYQVKSILFKAINDAVQLEQPKIRQRVSNIIGNEKIVEDINKSINASVYRMIQTAFQSLKYED